MQMQMHRHASVLLYLPLTHRSDAESATVYCITLWTLCVPLSMAGWNLVCGDWKISESAAMPTAGTLSTSVLFFRSPLLPWEVSTRYKNPNPNCQPLTKQKPKVSESPSSHVKSSGQNSPYIPTYPSLVVAKLCLVPPAYSMHAFIRVVYRNTIQYNNRPVNPYRVVSGYRDNLQGKVTRTSQCTSTFPVFSLCQDFLFRTREAARCLERKDGDQWLWAKENSQSTDAWCQSSPSFIMPFLGND
ncbi:hypothetical protein T310_3546 [Rasamsonia emersonii CBS 393.64]|uniref:Uncharacterized protein n=1 Tax=Rasamsonia emersonii (strain ATCC 16479 / CBS 393.64 / IMI 116815) TaxID=1408163 RepID=A0A0F4YVY8_RASE3|nr:hypothetical protein T310_3546 [Rasamsonia emersonii CBS 393.64]KKA22467.1 hypothetical protein T310_3546 [Rasamsonia emersonii CBS 393.64]